MKRLLENQIPLVLREQYIPNSGNDGRPGKPKLGLRTDSSVAAFEAYEDPVFAKAAFLANGYAFDGMHGDIFSVDPARVGESIQAHIAASGPLELSSTNVPSFGFAALRDGEHYIQGGLRVVDQFPEMPVVEKTVGYKIYSGSGTLQLEANEAGHRITFEFSVPATDTYEVSLKPFEATSYGRYEVSIDREVLTEYDFYTPETGVKPFRVLESGVELSEGTHELTFQNMGKNDASSNYKMGVITCRFLNEAAVRERELKEERGNTQRSFSLTYGRTTDGGAESIERTETCCRWVCTRTDWTWLPTWVIPSGQNGGPSPRRPTSDRSGHSVSTGPKTRRVIIPSSSTENHRKTARPAFHGTSSRLRE
ncbi:hypothetical protein [Haladaptatus sp. GCM10025893]|uniref:hypothetical protein n=1 Tax=Haladaptatus sp. GCM10025893 TaxID=3252659 RepID=UPI003615329E